MNGNALLAQLYAVRAQVDAVIAMAEGEAATAEEEEPEPAPRRGRNGGECKHKNRETVSGFGPKAGAWVCADCGASSEEVELRG